MQDWLTLAFSANVRNRALKVALIVGVVIATINYCDKFWMGTVTLVDLLKIGLTFFVPYCVSTYSAVSAMREAARKASAI